MNNKGHVAMLILGFVGIIAVFSLIFLFKGANIGQAGAVKSNNILCLDPTLTGPDPQFNIPNYNCNQIISPGPNIPPSFNIAGTSVFTSSENGMRYRCVDVGTPDSAHAAVLLGNGCIPA